MKMSKPRPAQQGMLDYSGGTMGVSAVPGSGKTWTLTRLAAKMVAEHSFGPHQELLVVTMVNATVDNFESRIGSLVEEEGLIPNVDYRVCTHHTLGQEIVRSRPELVGLAEDFQVIDGRAAEKILEDVTLNWMRSHKGMLRGFLKADMSDNWERKVFQADWRFPRLLKKTAQNAIKHAKGGNLTPDELRQELAEVDQSLPLANMACSIYEGYERALRFREAVDYTDLVRMAHRVLNTDEDLTGRLREQWPYVLEDEAQDSSALQEENLRRIVGEEGNWVRVGDPNQAIYESFTTADPQLLKNFIDEAHMRCDLPNSGRSQASIMTLANQLIRNSRDQHPVPEVRGALSEPFIQPTPEGDPQPNPPDAPDKVVFFGNDQLKAKEGDSREGNEIGLVVKSLKLWTEAHPDKTVAVLAPLNSVCSMLSQKLDEQDVPFTDELLRLSSKTRRSAGALGNVLRYLANPTSPGALASAYKMWCRNERDKEGGKERLRQAVNRVSACERVEDYLWPQPGRDWLESDNLSGAPAEEVEKLRQFRTCVRRWLKFASLPIGQLILTLARELFDEPADMALAHRFAGLLRRAGTQHPEWGLKQYIDEMKAIANDERHSKVFGKDDTTFDPDKHPGKVAVTTMHKAKGMEWDRVHLVSMNEYHFPAGQPDDDYRSEKWYIRDDLNFQAEVFEQIDAAVDQFVYEEGKATKAARHEYARERLRLFYVGMTRAREELIITSNRGSRDNHDNAPSLAFHEMKTFWDNHADSA